MALNRYIFFRKKTVLIFILTGFIFLSALCEASGAKDDWALTLYRARLTIANMDNTLKFNAEYEDSYLWALALSKRVSSFKKYIDIEIEGQAVKHNGEQDHWEFNALPVVRWLPFPWDSYIDTSFAVGGGVSYAAKIPKLEPGANTNKPKLLGYLMSELSLAVPRIPHFNLVARFHHRSGAGGLFSGVRDASNAIGFGVKIIF